MVGRGGMGLVWLARDEKLQQDVALKFLSDEMLHDPTAVERLKRETRHSLQLTHPNILRIYDFVEDARFAAIVMEYVDGWSLWAMKVDRPEQRFPREEIVPWVRQLCAALDYAHGGVRIVHRDLKPSNLLIDARNQLKISDFGIAWSLTPSGNDTTTHPVLGTINYMSPQQARGEEPSVADDVYSLGATIYELITGTPPFYKGELYLQVCEGTPPGMSDRLLERGIEDTSIPWHWEETIAACLAKDPGSRPSSVMEVLHRLETPGTSPRTARVEAPVETEEPFERPKLPLRKILVNGSIVLAIGISALIGWKWGGPLMAKLKSIRLPATSDNDSSASTNAKGGQAGSLDLSFDPGEGTPEEIRCLAIQPDDKLLIGGPFKAFDGDTTRFGITRLTKDGRADPGFSGNAQGTVHSVAVQRNGQIIIGGDFGFVRHTRCKMVARLHADGTLDGNFDPGSGGDKEVRSVLPLLDGKVMAGGHFTGFNGVKRARMVRLHEDGSVDLDFFAGFSDVVWTMVSQPDEDILYGGNFVHKRDVRLMRRHADGTADLTFKTGNGPNDIVYALAVQRDRKILVGGKFGRIAGVARNSLARVNYDGSIDLDFNPPLGDGSVQAIALQADGKILIGGTFTNIGGALCNRLARLNENGTVDATFDSGSGPNAYIRSIALQSDGKIVIAGGFGEVNGVKRGRIARLHAK